MVLETEPRSGRRGGTRVVATVTCARCHQPTKKPGWYAKQHPDGRFYCGPCYREYGTRGTKRPGRPTTRIAVECIVCGKSVWRYQKQIDTNKTKEFWCKGACADKGRSQGLKARAGLKARELDRFHNGYRARLDFNGYVLVYEPGSRVKSTGVPQGWCWEHRLVAERTIGRPLTSEDQVHHINGIKTDNRPDNLMVCSRQEHKTIHMAEIAEKLRRLAEYERLYGPLPDELPTPVPVVNYVNTPTRNDDALEAPAATS